MKKNPITIENIERLRREQAIEDVELRNEIRTLTHGDFVRLTFLAQCRESSGETLAVRITSIRGSCFRGKIVESPNARLAPLRIGYPVTFTRAHIHSIADTKVCLE